MSNDKKFYVYAYVRLDTNTYFYIGKGTGKRYKELYTGRTEHFQNIVNKIPYKVKILRNDLTEKQALKLEMNIIHHLVFNEEYSIAIQGYNKKSEKYLVNCTFGGEGISGYKYTEEQRKKCARPGKQNGMYGRKGELCPSYGLVRDDDFKNRVRKNNPKSTKCYCIELDRVFDSCRQAKKILEEEYGISITFSWLSKNLDNEDMVFGIYIKTNEKANLHFKRI